MSGLGLLVTGAGLVLRRARLFGLGLIPPLITTVLFLVLFATASFLSQRIAVWLTPFAEGWPGVATLRAFVAILVVALSGVLLVLLFTATTLALGAPLYDRISEEIDAHAGSYASAPTGRLIAITLTRWTRVDQSACSSPSPGALMLLVGLIPGVGGFFAAVGSALFGGWMIALEMTGSAAGRRGLRGLAERHRLLCRDPWPVLGFGVPTFLLLSVPLLSLLVFPIATAAGTLLTRRLAAR